ncbi:hypothetical protein [Streptomyces sp. BK239]|uniref:hypothetical protein n=1 Tax=Streptomyces sp. BK239 TaxID=2512155 RepID=UPI0010DBDA38|nr:hypothetical protein [Streptomyces sp. BK239]RZU15084.1 hypothetical protein EV567_4068 [Streptomyces sp. BK239]
MGWAGVRRRVDKGRAWPESVAAVAAGAAQLPAVCALLFWQALAADRYGVGYGPAFGLLCLLLFAPVLLPVLGLLHAGAQILPGALVADVVLRRVPWPRWVRRLLGVTLVGAVWAVVGAVWAGMSFFVTVACLAALGALPVLAMEYARVRPKSNRGLWWRAAGASVVLFVLALVGGSVASAVGLVEEYEPPALSAERVAGVWRGEDGAVLKLLPGGRAELTRMPVDPGGRATVDFVVCDGVGSWRLEPGRVRDGVVVRLAADEAGEEDGCRGETVWSSGGTERSPELFVFFGDPDASSPRVLTRDP